MGGSLGFRVWGLGFRVREGRGGVFQTFEQSRLQPEQPPRDIRLGVLMVDPSAKVFLGVSTVRSIVYRLIELLKKGFRVRV